MNIEFKTITETSIVVKFLAQAISSRLEKGEKLLWLVAGGSCIPIVLEVSRIIAKIPHYNLTVTLTDERYGYLNHPDSNWYQLIEKGFSLPEATLIPVLLGDNSATTVKNFDSVLGKFLVNDIYKIGLFGIGEDGHTAGILPGSEAVQAQTFAYRYTTLAFERITMTPRAISRLDEAVVCAVGEGKWPTLAKLREDTTISEQPAQALKNIPKVTVFTDYKIKSI